MKSKVIFLSLTIYYFLSFESLFLDIGLILFPFSQKY